MVVKQGFSGPLLCLLFLFVCLFSTLEETQIKFGLYRNSAWQLLPTGLPPH